MAGSRRFWPSIPNAIPRTAEIGLDWTRARRSRSAVAVVTGLHLRARAAAPPGQRSAPAQAFREASTRTTAGRARLWFRSALVVGEVALAVTLVVGAGLLIRSFFNLTRVDMGFNQSQLSTFGVVLPAPKYNAQQRVDFYTQLHDAAARAARRAERLGDVGSAAAPQRERQRHGLRAHPEQPAARTRADRERGLLSVRHGRLRGDDGHSRRQGTQLRDWPTRRRAGRR